MSAGKSLFCSATLRPVHLRTILHFALASSLYPLDDQGFRIPNARSEVALLKHIRRNLSGGLFGVLGGSIQMRLAI
jgi:hypothetical protein